MPDAATSTNRARDVIAKFGGQTALADHLGLCQSTVQYWAKIGIIPARRQPQILRLAQDLRIPLSPADFMEVPVQPAAPAVVSRNDAGRTVDALAIARADYAAPAKGQRHVDVVLRCYLTRPRGGNLEQVQMEMKAVSSRVLLAATEEFLPRN